MTINRKTHLYEYLDFVKMAKLDCKSKALLYFYATSYNWTQNQPSWYSQRSICALVSMAPSTYNATQKKLENLGWIKTKHRGRDKTVQVWVSVGNADPEYDSSCWATWHPFNLEIDDHEEEEHDPFEHRTRQQEAPRRRSKEPNDPDEGPTEARHEFKERAANEAFWAILEGSQDSTSKAKEFNMELSEHEFNDLATELWGV